MTSVLMTADTVGGEWTYALALADALAPAGVSVTLATMGRRLSADQREAAAHAALADLHESSFKLEWMDDPWPDVDRAGGWLLGLERDVRPDVVHLNGFVHGALPWQTPTLVVGHSCVSSWWHAVRGVEAPPAWDEYRQRVTEGLGAAGAVAAPTTAMLAELRRWYDVVGGHVLPNGRSGDWVRPVPKEPLVIAGGRVWDEAKNVELLTKVADRLAWPVAVAGGLQPPGAGARATAPAGPSRGGTQLLGRLSFGQFAAWLLRASVFVLPARYEPFGLAALEAGLAGCALVLGDIASLREVWGDAALFVDPDDADGLVHAVERLTGDAALRAEMGQRARRRAARFSPERMADAYLTVYGSLLGTGGGRQ